MTVGPQHFTTRAGANDSIEVLDEAHAVSRDAKTKSAEDASGASRDLLQNLRPGDHCCQTLQRGLHMLILLGGMSDATKRSFMRLRRGRQSISASWLRCDQEDLREQGLSSLWRYWNLNQSKPWENQRDLVMNVISKVVIMSRVITRRGVMMLDEAAFIHWHVTRAQGASEV